MPPDVEINVTEEETPAISSIVETAEESAARATRTAADAVEIAARAVEQASETEDRDDYEWLSERFASVESSVAEIRAMLEALSQELRAGLATLATMEALTQLQLTLNPPPATQEPIPEPVAVPAEAPAEPSNPAAEAGPPAVETLTPAAARRNRVRLF